MEDMSEIVNKFSEILKEKNIDLNDVLSNISSSSNDSSTKTSDNVDNSSGNSNSVDNSFGNIDIDTIMKIKNIMDKVNSGNNSSRTKLLMSLKPYLKESRKNKLDQCIQLANMSNIFESFGNRGKSSS